MSFSVHNLWSAFSLQPLISILHIFSLFLFVTAAVFTLSFDLCLFDHSFIPNLPHPSRVYSFILPRYLPTCSYLHSLTNPLLFLVFVYLSQNRSYAHMAPSLFDRTLSATIIQQKVTKTQSLTHSFTNSLSSSSWQTLKLPKGHIWDHEVAKRDFEVAKWAHMLHIVCMYFCVRETVLACMHACVSACVWACVWACVCLV